MLKDGPESGQEKATEKHHHKKKHHHKNTREQDKKAQRTDTLKNKDEVKKTKSHHGHHHHSKKQKIFVKPADVQPTAIALSPAINAGISTPVAIPTKPQENDLKPAVEMPPPPTPLLPLNQSLEVTILSEGRRHLKESDDQLTPPIVSLHTFSSDDRSHTSWSQLARTYIPGFNAAASIVPSIIQMHQCAGRQLVNKFSTIGQPVEVESPKLK